jgi:hypothetical protein
LHEVVVYGSSPPTCDDDCRKRAIGDARIADLLSRFGQQPLVIPDVNFGKIPMPTVSVEMTKSTNNNRQCPSGVIVDIARSMVGGGKTATKLWVATASAGATTFAVGGAMAVASGGTFVPADGMMAVGAFTMKLGEAFSMGGLATQVFGASVLYAMGDPQPLQSAMLAVASAKMDDQLKIPGLPVGVVDPRDAAIDQAVGPPHCPQ